MGQAAHLFLNTVPSRHTRIRLLTTLRVQRARGCSLTLLSMDILVRSALIVALLPVVRVLVRWSLVRPHCSLSAFGRRVPVPALGSRS